MKKPLTFSLAPSDRAKLEAAAKSEMRSISNLLQTLVAEYLARQNDHRSNHNQHYAA